ncbi:whole genome shotgun sequence [Seminavis robusta]|uniref:Whole genome shotgun sequence n=1 Tax=Seminavis robusta TaxID=568900 RepID=A0A9N8D819_9STRA|nr:whole genome shotgun sequence [Seminavis robusta]|eukprot:Sro26_g017570.1 whole genome shotgun sequence (1311) ;mRNA; f:58956-63044
MVFSRTSDRGNNPAAGASIAASMENSGVHAMRRPTTRGLQQVVPPRQASLNFMGLSMSRYRQSSATGARSSNRRLNSHNNHNDSPDTNSQFVHAVRSRAPYRRYRVGENILITCNSHWATSLVNRHGFPPGEGTTAEEQSGPYSFVMATVLTVHFDEFAEYYTVKRSDNGAEQRADTAFMEPFKTQRGEQAALRAATQSTIMSPDEVVRASGPLNANNKNRNVFIRHLQTCCLCLCMPLLWLFDCFLYLMGEYVCRFCNRFYQATKRQANLCLNGKQPWVCSVRVTSINVVVLCSTWYMFSDQARLAFFPSSADYALAVINFVVWCILIIELLFELFIRPDGYQDLIISDKAYAPTTVRYINAFHLLVESVSLLCFIPEFYCLFSVASCGERLGFSFFNAALLGVTGPSRADFFFGKAYFALIRFRVFGLVRHWKKMWINNTFINMRWKAAHGFFSGSSSKQVTSNQKNKRDQHKSNKTETSEDAKKKESVLTNASNIGTALMVTNSYRVLIMLCAIVGVFPVLASIASSSSINRITKEMTDQLQATNLLVTDNSNSSCMFLRDSVLSWVAGLTPSEGRRLVSTDTNVFLLSLTIEPNHCRRWLYPPEDDNSNNNDTNTTIRPETTPPRLKNNTHVLSDVCVFIKRENPSLTQKIEDESADMAGSNVDEETVAFLLKHCRTWNKTGGSTSAEDISNKVDLRIGSITVVPSSTVYKNYTIYEGNNTSSVENTTYSVTAVFNESYAIESSAMACFLLQFCVLISVLGGLSVLRRDAEVLVLGPLRRMLKIVAGYAKNPLIQPKIHRRGVSRNAQGKAMPDHSDATLSDSDDSMDGTEFLGNDLGNYETEQLINAVSKITDLLRKCWGVAGADIISTNLATREGALTEVFNPTVPGKSVYALFGFAAIKGFDHALKNLGGDVMVLINDVAKVLHDEVYRWGFGNSGQCNKNLGAAFLMVFRIGLVKEVIEKLEQATDVIFSTHTKHRTTSQAKQKARIRKAVTTSTTTPKSVAIAKATAAKLKGKVNKRKEDASVNAMSVSLQSLPGISTFTDCAVIGMLKSYASIHRDKKLLTWNDDFRLGAGVGAFTVSLIYGMDAGWAVEGAVGSEYKIDATYLSPHVNMASRMMSACKQYGVSILLSQAVQELMSDAARSKLRHLDTVTVKGSSVKQRIYTYDARNRGVDFFLFSRTDDQADFEADRYSPNMWNVDQDLKAMRQHLEDDFLDEFKAGRKAYLQGDWPLAVEKLNIANEIMLETAVEAGYLVDPSTDAVPHEEELAEHGDGPTLFLLNYIKSKGGVAPDDWEGWHPLTSK